MAFQSKTLLYVFKANYIEAYWASFRNNFQLIIKSVQQNNVNIATNMYKIRDKVQNELVR